MDELILVLLKHGAYVRPIKITTTELGKMLRMSQQNASHRLCQLEKDGIIERKHDCLELTKKAKEEIIAVYADLRAALEDEKLDVSGRITKGLGEGKYYLSLDGYKKQIKEKFGFVPFPGTLNIELDEEEMWKKQHVLRMEPTVILGFKDKTRTYGDLFAYKCKIEGIECILIVPIRTHHGPKIIEIVSQFDLKKSLKKKDGNKIKVIF
ncbi:MAG: DUF120 domain-containing protein [Candidatus Micrarchaeota archaeon]